MRRLATEILLAALALTGVAQGQEIDLYDEQAVGEILGRPISEVLVDPPMEGTSDGMTFFGIQPGQPVTHELVWEMLARMWLTGKVGEVSVFGETVVDGSVALHVDYQFRMLVKNVEIKGNKKLGKKKILEFLAYRPDMEVYPDTLERMEEILESEYELRGYPDASFLIELEPGAEPDEVVISLTVIEGVPVRIAEVVVEYLEGDPLVGPVPVFELKGALGLGAGDVLDRTRLDKGLEAIDAKLQARGYLNTRAMAETILDDAGKTTLKVSVKTGMQVRFVIVGNDHQTDETILEVMDPTRVLPLNVGIVEEMAQRVMDHLRSLGFLEARVLVQQKEIPAENALVYRFTVDEGPRIRVAKIDFSGNDQFSTKFLKKQVVSFLYEEVPYDVVFSGVSFDAVDSVLLGGGTDGVEHGKKKITKPLPMWPPEWIFWSEAYEEAIAHIEKLYISEGYLNVAILAPAIAREEDTLEVTLVIDEGMRTYVDTVDYEGNEAIEDDELAAVTGIRPGSPFSGLGVKDAESAILEVYADAGHRFATVETRVDFSADASTATVHYVIAEGPQVIVDKILVKGNGLTTTSLIKDRIAFGPGDVFTLKKEKKSLNRLHRLNIFRSVTIEMLEPSLADERKTIVIEVVERKPQYLSLKGGASTAEGVRGSMEYAYRNLFGYAVDFHFRIALNYRLFFVGVTQEFRDWYLNMNLLDQMERNFGVGLTLPHLPVIGNYFTFETSFAHLRRNANIYGITSNAFTGSILMGTGKRFSFTVQSGFESSSINANTEITEDLMSLELSPIDRQTLRVPHTDKPATFVVTGGNLSLDFRDNPFNPTRGFSLNAAVSWIISSRPIEFTWYEPVTDDGSPVPEDPYRSDQYLKARHHETATTNILKLYLDLTGYFSLGTPRVVLMLHAGAGIIVPLMNHTQTFPDRFFYLGGARSLRGVPEEGLCAQDEYRDKQQCFQGGELMVMYKTELRVMLRGNLGLAFFVDAGNLWHGWNDMYGTGGVGHWYSVFYDLRFTAGAGVRYITPVGPINLDVGFLLNRHDVLGEPVGAFHFSIGTF